MPELYTLRRPEVGDLEFYRSCLASPDWRARYGLEETGDGELGAARRMALSPYANVRRLIVCRRSTPVGFFHVEEATSGDGRCFLAGGVGVGLLSRGRGVTVCCIALDYVFSRLSARKICCKVRCANSASYRMLLGVGFRLEGTARKHEYNWQAGEYSDCYFLGLLRSEYPGPFTAKALNRITYEER